MGDPSEDKKHRQWLSSFVSLNWYEEAIKFIFNFVTKTSELLLAAGIVISTANFLTDGDVMSHNKALSDAWSWAQALAIDSSLGIVFMNAFVAMREHEKIKAAVFITLTVLLATVAGLITHFDALAHAAGLPVSDKSISGVIPLWIMTALRAVAVIGFLLASRLKNISLNELGRELTQKQELEQVKNQEQQKGSAALSIDYNALAVALVGVMQQVGAIQKISTDTQDELTISPEAEERNPGQRPYPKLILLQGTGTANIPGLDEAQEPNSSNGNQQRRDAGTEREPEPVTNGNPSMGTEASRYQRREPANGNQLSENRGLPITPGTNGKSGSHRWEPGKYQGLEPINGNLLTGTNKQPQPKLIAIGSGSVEERLSNAYQAMQVEGEKITGHALGSRARVRKQTALEWLKTASTGVGASNTDGAGINFVEETNASSD